MSVGDGNGYAHTTQSRLCMCWHIIGTFQGMFILWTILRSQTLFTLLFLSVMPHMYCLHGFSWIIWMVSSSPRSNLGNFFGSLLRERARSTSSNRVRSVSYEAKKEPLRLQFAEGEGFEPPVPLGTTVFKTVVIDHSTIPPKRQKSGRWHFCGCKGRQNNEKWEKKDEKV